MTELLHTGAAGEPEPAPGAGPGPGRAPFEPEIHRVPMRETAVIVVETDLAGLPEAMGRAFGEVEAAMDEAGVGLDGPPFARYLAFEPRIRAEVGFPVRRPAPDVGRVVPGRLPGGRIASILHVGPYEGLAATYGRLTRWLAELGLTPTGPLWEVYWSDPSEAPDPATWQTEVFAPVE